MAALRNRLLDVETSAKVSGGGEKRGDAFEDILVHIAHRVSVRGGRLLQTFGHRGSGGAR